MAAGVDNPLPFEVGFRDLDDSAVANADIANRVKIGLGVHDPAVGDHHIIGFGVYRTGEAQGQRGQYEFTRGHSRFPKVTIIARTQWLPIR